MEIGRTGKITIVAALVLILTIGMFAAINQSTIAGKPAPPPTWTLRLPSSYSGSRQLFVNFFPELTASKFHYYNPNLAGGGALLSLTINFESVSAKYTDLVFTENWHLQASGVNVAVGIPIGIGDIRVAHIVCKELTADVNIWPPDEDGVFGTLSARLKGDVLLSVPNVPGSPMTGYYFVGQELLIQFTFVEPIYSVTVDPDELTIPVGCNSDPTPITVTVEPEEAGISSYVNLGFDCEMGGINGGFSSGGGTPPLTSSLQISVAPWVPEGTYTAYVVANDYSSGKHFDSNPITITVTGGFFVTVDGNNPAPLGQIMLDETRGFKIAVSPVSPCYTNGLQLYWRPTDGDFSYIDVGVPNNIPPPYCEDTLYIHVKPGAPLAIYQMDLIAYDGNFGKEYTCHVTFEVVSP